MDTLREKEALSKIVALITEWTDIAPGETYFNLEGKGFNIDLIQKTGDWVFVIEYKGNSSVQFVASAIDKLHKNAKQIDENAIPVVAVPFMGDVGRNLCEEKRVFWVDLSGNAHIVAPGLRIHIEGKPNKYKLIGRPKDIFAPKSSRITRHLLIAPDRYITQRELTQETNLDEGLVSRVVREMEKTGLLNRGLSGGVRPKDPHILLDAWYEKYSFLKHRLIRGFVAERTSDLAVKNLAAAFKENNLNYALTGLSAAWLLSSFATYRTVTVYLSAEPPAELLKKLGFTKGDKGSNVWLVIPNDEGVFNGATSREGIRHVHPVQVYLDLKGHPERAKEAALALRKQYLTWRTDAI